MKKILYAPLLDAEELAALMNSQPMRHCPKVAERIFQEAEDILKGERLHFSEENNIPSVSLQDFFSHYIFAIDAHAYNFHKGTGADKSEAMDLVITEIIRLYSKEKTRSVTSIELSNALMGNISFHLSPEQELQLKETLERILFTQI
ncbi:MAG: hypothetical protein PHH16_03095 [Candidatus Gracilibacteria bacterium]|nr:hypothetical protein [Candidatus Gracilibacteria bacterium]